MIRVLMTMRPALALFVVLGILGIPSLCTAGALLHPCDCGTAIECGHEEACGDDPCVDVLAGRESASLDPELTAPVAVFVPGPALAPGPTVPEPGHVPALRNLPCPPSILPLLS